MDKSSKPQSHREFREVVGDNLRALIRYAHFAAPDEAIAVARSLLSDGSWAQAVNDLRGLLDNKLAPLSGWPLMASDVLQALADDREAHGGIRAEAHELIKLLGRRGPDDARERLASWFLEVAEPGEARLAIDLLGSALEQPEPACHAALRPWSRPLVRWLVDRGAAELARGEHPLVMLHVIETCRTAFPDRLIGALKILERSDKPDAVLTVDGAGERIVYPAIEAALGRGLPVDWVAHVLGGTYAAFHALGPNRFFAPFDPAHEMPQLREALLDALAKGRWRSGLGIEVWKRAFVHAPPATLTFDEDGLETALHALARARNETTIPDESLSAWTEVIADAWLAHFGLRQPQASMTPGVWSLDILAAEPRFAAGIARALARNLKIADGNESGISAAREVMARAAHDPRLASVALLLLSHPEAGTDDVAESLDEVRELLRAIVGAEWSLPVAGLDRNALFRGAHEVVITDSDDLDPQVLIDFRDDAIRTGDTKTYRRIVRDVCRRGTREDALAVCAIYFVHEALHVLQGIQPKSRVTALRATGSEHTLAHLDLEADDLAARVIAAATSWSLAYLKGIEGSGAMAFPASMHHTNASVTRKSVRLISLRLDHLVRERGLLGMDSEADGYVSVEVPFGAGELLVIRNGPHLHRLLATAPVDAGEADRLTRIARDGRELAALDRLLIDLLGRAQMPTD